MSPRPFDVSECIERYKTISDTQSSRGYNRNRLLGIMSRFVFESILKYSQFHVSPLSFVVSLHLSLLHYISYHIPIIGSLSLLLSCNSIIPPSLTSFVDSRDPEPLVSSNVNNFEFLPFF